MLRAVIGSGVRVEWYEGERAAIRDHFALAEDSDVQLHGYLDLGRVLVALDGERVVGHLQLVHLEGSDVELKSMAVVPDRRGQGVGRVLVEAALSAAASEGAHRMLVGTGAADTGNLRFYQRCGFRLLSVERDAFTPETGYPDEIRIDGIVLRDRVWFDQPLRRA
jgi:GNAT superfamily N-acetyltransferase